MTVKEPRIFLGHIQESIKEIYNHIGKMSKEEFGDDIKTQDSVIRRMEIIGEAIKNIPETFRKDYPDIPWKDIAGLRDVLIHEYYNVDLDEVWSLINGDLKDLQLKINEALRKL